jgi:hypothetical protein
MPRRQPRGGPSPGGVRDLRGLRPSRGGQAVLFRLVCPAAPGQESAGISVVRNGVLMCEHRAMGLVSDVFSMEQLERLRAPAPSGTCATPPPAVRCWPTPSPSWCATATKPMQWVTTATSSTPTRSRPNWKRRARSSSPPWTARFSCTCSCATSIRALNRPW